MKMVLFRNTDNIDICSPMGTKCSASSKGIIKVNLTRRNETKEKSYFANGVEYTV